MVCVTVSEGELKGGKVVTNSGCEYYEFLSVPYAKPPIGDLRFKSPQPPEPWSDVRDATRSDGNISCQWNYVNNTVTGNEDCLYLNVYTPNITDTSRLLPVMFYIHGGGFLCGNGFKYEQGPEYLVENDVVVVSTNYRLGVFGFLNLNLPEASGNMGLKDQVQALKWVQENIEKFGGDKNNVTIFGISAGSASVEYLMLSQKAKGLFHKAIQQSGSSINPWAINNEYDSMNKIFLENLEYKGDVSDKRAVYDFLFKAPANKLIASGTKTADSYTNKSIMLGFVPTVENDFSDAFLTEQPYELLKKGNFIKVPLIKGLCEREGLMMLYKPAPVKDLITKKDFVKFLSEKLTPEDKQNYNQRFLNLYTNEDNEDDDFALDFFGDLNFSAGIWISANLVSNYIPTYVYKFTYDGKINFLKTQMGVNKRGASHADDTTYLFENNQVSAKPDETDVLVRSRLTKMWTNFARTGNPTSNGIPENWPKFNENNKVYLKIDKELAVENNHEPEKMAVFQEIYQKLGTL